MPTSILSTLLAQPTTLMPCWTSARATAAPIPTEAPVTRATLPFHRSISLRIVYAPATVRRPNDRLDAVPGRVCRVKAATVAGYWPER